MALVFALCAPARVRAWAQWQTPYDPDFPSPAGEPAPAKPPLVVQPEQPAVSTGVPAAKAPAVETPAVLLPAGMRFLLVDREDPDRFFETSGSTPSPEMSQFLSRFKPLELTPGRWQKMRDDYERGRLPSEEEEEVLPLPPSEIIVSSTTVAPAPPEVELPSYGTSLSVTGRKVVGVNFSEQRYLAAQATTNRAQTTNLINITQQLQLRMQGKVGPKISVNVDYDDTKTNKQDISVVYTGDPNEVVQNASFGDIDLSLPATEFVSYNKQLFGIRADLKYKGFKGTFIGSRTKGTTKFRQFIGNTQYATLDILDTAYMRRTYYDLTFSTRVALPIQPGSEKVYLSNPLPNAVNSNAVVLTADDLGDPGSTVTAKFVQLAAGSDYTMDYIHGIIQFRVSIDPAFIVAVDLNDVVGRPLSGYNVNTSTGPGTGRPKIIKTTGDVPIVSTSTNIELGWRRELKTAYSMGATQIVRDNGRGNFILKVLDTQRNDVGALLNPVQHYPETITVDFENGLYRLANPFGAVTCATCTTSAGGIDPDIYAPSPISKRLFHTEYSYRLKTFLLEPNLVLQSETILIDGIKLVRNVDYFIDYDSGFVTFFNENRIGPTSAVDISYEVAPFVGATSDSILGGRVSYDFNKHFSMGTTLLYESGSKPPTVPSITDLARSLLIYDFDSQVKDLRLTKWLKATIQGEYARSDLNPNLSKFALIDNMEGAKQEDLAPTLATSWQIAANPGAVPSDPNALSWNTEDVLSLQINPNAQASGNQSQKVLDFGYNFDPVTSNNTTEVSLVSVFSPTGRDFSQKQILQVTVFGDNSGNQLDFRLGGIDENADGSGIQRTENPECDGVLHPGEDVGFTYAPPSTLHKGSAIYGANNGRIDSGDLNQNCRLDPDDGSGDNYGYSAVANPANANLFDATTKTSLPNGRINFTGWHVLEIPLNIDTSKISSWNAIKEVRISVKQGAGGHAAGVLRFAKVAVVGSTWQRGQAGDPAINAGPQAAETLAISAVNNVDNPNYVPIFNAGGEAQATFSDLYGSISNLRQQNNTQNLSEQALQLTWNTNPPPALTTGTTFYTKRTFPTAINLSQHKRFNFLLYGNPDSSHVDVSGKNVFFLRAGTDQSYFEVRVPINFVGWRRVAIAQVDTLGTQIPNSWAPVGNDVPAGTVVVTSGTPSLQQIGELVAGVYKDPATPAIGAAWLDEIYMSDAIERVGTAQKLQMDFEVPGWASFGGKYRSVDHNYQTPTTVVTNQDNRQDSAYMNFVRLAFFPMNFTLNRGIVVTPNVADTSQLSNLMTLLQAGRVTTWNGTANGAFAYGALPRLSLGYVRARTEYDLLTRLDDRSTYNSAFSYAFPHPKRWLPQTVDLTYSLSDYKVTYTRPDARLLSPNTDELTHTYGSRLTFSPWTGASFNPNVLLTEVKEKADDVSSGGEVKRSYPKSVNETVGFSSNWRVVSWFNPSVNYSVTNIENNVLSTTTLFITTDTVTGSSVPFNYNIGDLKTINRNATGSISWLLNVSDLYKRTKLFRSLSFANGYQLQDGDVWNNVEKELDSRTALWVRTPLHPHSPVAQLANQTLRDTYNSTQRWQPLEGYTIGGRAGAFRTLALSNNWVYSLQRTETTNTPSKTVARTLPDLVASLSQLERLLFSERWMQNGQINFKFAKRTTEVVSTSFNSDTAIGGDIRAIIRKRFDTTITVNLHDTRQRDLIQNVDTNLTHHEDATLQTTFDVSKFRFTPKVDYAKDTTTLGTGVQSQNVMVITPSVLARADLALPRGLMLPFTGKTLLFTNRVIWTSTLSMAMRSSPVTQADNSKLLSFNTSGDYEIAKNLRMTLSGAASRLWHKYLAEENYISYQFGTTLTFQF